MTFEHRLTARLHHVDRAGIVFFGRAFEYAHDCFEEIIAATWGDFDAAFDRLGYGMPVVHAQTSYQKPIRMAERLVISAHIARIGARSVTFVYAISGASEGDLRCTVTLRHAFVELSTFQSQPVPADFRAAMEKIGLLPQEPPA